MKKCNKCNTQKGIEEFHKNKRNKDGSSCWCKMCNGAYGQSVDKEKKSKYHKEYGIVNKITIAIKRKKYDKFRKKEKTEYDREYSRANREKLSKKKKEYFQLNRDRIAIKRKEYRRKNRDKINRHLSEKRKINPQFKLKCDLRSRLNNALKRNQKTGSAVRDLGCSIAELKNYLESKFQEGMNWENWSPNGWHIDHIHPLSKFDLSDRKQFLKAVNYTNLQPMWSENNLKKGNKIIIDSP